MNLIFRFLVNECGRCLRKKGSLWYNVLCAKYCEEGWLCVGGRVGSVWWQNVNHIRREQFVRCSVVVG